MTHRTITIPPALDKATKRLMYPIAYQLYSMTLVGNPAATVKAMYDRMTSPQAGDLIIECSTVAHLMRPDSDPDSDLWDGQFVTYSHSEMRTTPYEDGSGDGFTDEVHVCLNPDGTEFVWTNARIVAVPSDMQFGRTTP